MSSMPGVCGTGGWSGPKPGDPDNNSILSATPAFGGIDVSWTYPSTNPFAVAHVLVYRGVSADYMGAIYLATVSGSLYYDKTDIEMPIEYFYWIRLVSINGTYGELIGPASAVARPSIERTIEQLTGKIDAGVLAQSLRAELDQISILNGNLLDEITARENGEITLAQALADVDGGVAQALTFIHEEISSRVTADSAQAENLNLVAATLGDEMAAVTTSMTAEIDAVTGTVNAMYTAKVNVNGLIGGFGLANDGAFVEAGFDVDTFWVGRTSANKRKPFIISGQETFIDEAVINKLTFNKLRADDGSFVVENGKVKADYLTAQAITVKNAAGTVVLADGNGVFTGNVHGSQFTTGAYTGYAWPAAGNYGTYLGPSGLKIGNANNNKYLQLTQDGDIYSPGFDIVNGAMTLKSLNVVNTANIAGNAVTVSNSAGGTATAGTSVYVPSGQTMKILCICYSDPITIFADDPAYVGVSGAFNGTAFSSQSFTSQTTGTGNIHTNGSTTWMGHASVTGPATVAATANGSNVTVVLLGTLR